MRILNREENQEVEFDLRPSEVDNHELVGEIGRSGMGPTLENCDGKCSLVIECQLTLGRFCSDMTFAYRSPSHTTHTSYSVYLNSSKIPHYYLNRRREEEISNSDNCFLDVSCT
ncbi:hypothetical protein Tco_0013648 [Tanacetum coccineum]